MVGIGGPQGCYGKASGPLTDVLRAVVRWLQGYCRKASGPL